MRDRDPEFPYVSRRGVLLGAAGCLSAAVLLSGRARADQDFDSAHFVEQLTGKKPTPSRRVRLDMPKTFPNGYTVPLAFEIDTPMTEADHVRYVRVLAPKNPLIDVATFRFTPGRSRPRISTRVRLAEPQFVVAVAEMNDGSLLLAETWVHVETNGCA